MDVFSELSKMFLVFCVRKFLLLKTKPRKNVEYFGDTKSWEKKYGFTVGSLFHNMIEDP